MEEEIKALREKNLKETKKAIAKSVTSDELIINAANTYEQLDKEINVLGQRLKYWHSTQNPEHVKKSSIEKLTKEIVKDKEPKTEMGASLSNKDKDIIKKYASTLVELITTRNKIKEYIEEKVKESYPNLSIIAGTNISSKLIREAGSLKRLATMQSSTIQLLGAEKALFKHITRGSKPPKYGYIHSHDLVRDSKDKGKAARLLADKLSMAARLDYFKGELKAYELLEDLHRKMQNG